MILTELIFSVSKMTDCPRGCSRVRADFGGGAVGIGAPGREAEGSSAVQGKLELDDMVLISVCGGRA